MIPRPMPPISPVRIIEWLKCRVKTPIENGKESPSIRHIPKRIENTAESIPVSTDS